MGKAGRRRKHDERMKKRRAAKAARRALYASLAGTSRRRKRRQVASRSLTAGTFKGAHVMQDCGNVGCLRCYPACYLKGNGGLTCTPAQVREARLRRSGAA